MPNFALYFRHGAATGKLLFDDLTTDALTGSYDRWAAYNPQNGILYLKKNGTPNQLVGVRVSDKNELYSYNVPSNALLPIFCDHIGRVWCIQSPANKYIYVFSPDLATFSTFTLKGGNPLSDSIDMMAPTWDLEYMYLIYNAASGKIAKYDVDNLDGGDPEWSQTIANASYVITDEYDYPYWVSNLYITKAEKTTGAQIWQHTGYDVSFYSKNTGKIYTPDKYASPSKYVEYDTDGNLDGYSSNIHAYQYSMCIYPDASENYIYGGTAFRTVGGSTNNIYKYNNSDWASPESPVQEGVFGAITDHLFAGDPSGYLCTQLYNNFLAGSETYINYGNQRGIIDRHYTVVCDSANDRVVKRTVEKSENIFNVYDLKYHSKIGSIGSGNDNFYYPQGCVITPDKKYVIVCDTYNHRIVKRDFSDLSYVCEEGSFGTGDDNFKYPRGVAITPDGKYIIITDTGNHRLMKRRVSDLGYVAKFGSWGQTNDTFNYPQGCAISSDGLYVIVCDTWNHRIKKHLVSDLSFVSTAGSYGDQNGYYDEPSGCAITLDDEYVIICDKKNNRIQKIIFSTLAYKSKIGSLGSGNDQFHYPNGCAISQDWKFLIVVDEENHRIVKRDPADLSYIFKIGSFGTGNDQFLHPIFCCIDPDCEFVIVTDAYNCRIVKRELLYKYSDLIYQDEYGTSGSGNNNLDNPYHCDITPDNKHVLIADADNYRLMIRNFDDLTLEAYKTHMFISDMVSDGTYVYVLDDLYVSGKVKKYDLATFTLQATSATNFDNAYGIAITPDFTNLLIADTGNDKVVKLLCSDLSFVAQLGSSGSGNDQFDGPQGIDVSEDGLHFLVADTGNDRIVKRLVSDLSYVAQCGSTGTDDDNFDTPTDVAITCDNLFFLVVDSGNDRIVRHSLIDMSYVSEIGSTGTGNDQFNIPSGVALTRIGLTRVETIANPASNYFYNKLLKYLPDFIEVNEILIAILRGFETVLLKAKKWINASTDYALKNHRYQGTPLDQGLIERHIFYSGNETEREKQWLIENALQIHEIRGTKIGIRDDLIRMTEDENVSVEEIDEDQSGWWLNLNYPQIDADFDPDPDAPSSFLNCLDQIEIKLFDTNKKYSNAKLKNIINRYLIPGHVTAHIKTEPNLTWYIAVNYYGDGMNLSKKGL